MDHDAVLHHVEGNENRKILYVSTVSLSLRVNLIVSCSEMGFVIFLYVHRLDSKWSFGSFFSKKSALFHDCMFSAVVLHGVNWLRYLAVTSNSIFVVHPPSGFTFSVGFFSE